MGENIERCYEDLANAIIIQAVKDYKRSLKILYSDPGNSEARRIKSDCERFFYSDFYSGLTDVEPELIISRIKAGVKEVDNAKK